MMIFGFAVQFRVDGNFVFFLSNGANETKNEMTWIIEIDVGSPL